MDLYYTYDLSVDSLFNILILFVDSLFNILIWEKKITVIPLVFKYLEATHMPVV